ncbi:MAG: hypothetical protein JSV22_01360 [Bacteroidales bacterium]|nr:MAG: hypothetical protein JSV22_01360 [Bacteroidales bacterium]
MKSWSNIQISPRDPEIIKINNLEKDLGKLSDDIYLIRELITRFEVCHFKYQHHLEKIKNSITNLRPEADPIKIGTNHIQHGESAWKNDKTGRSIIGQQYIWAIRNWLSDDKQEKIPEHYNKKLGQQIEKWLGDKDQDKNRIIRLLIARLTWDWKSYEELQHGGEYKDLELQVCSMDICHYAFPANIDQLLKAIGKMKPVEKYEGCGSFNKSIKTYIEKEFSILNKMIDSHIAAGKSDKNELVKAWLIACLAKTLKEQVNMKEPLVELVK